MCYDEKIILWKEYKSRTTSNALRTIASQVGRNIKSLCQVVWYPLYLLLGFNPGGHRDLEAILRVFFYLSKMGYMLYNESDIVWTPYMIRILRDAIQQVVVYLERRMRPILQCW